MRVKPGTTGQHTPSEVDEARQTLRDLHADLEAVEVARDEDGRLTSETVEALIVAADRVRRIVLTRCCAAPCEMSRLVLEEQFSRLQSGHGGNECCEAHRALSAAVFGRGWPRQYRDEVTV